METAVQFLQYVVAQLVDNTDAIHIESKTDDRGILLTLSVDKEDMGKIIGKNGSTVQSLRNLLKLVGTKEGERINLKVADPE